MGQVIKNWQKIEEVFAEFKTSERGLNEEEVKLRLEQYGRNELAVKKVHFGKILLRQVENSMIYLLLVAAIISIFLKEYLDAVIILIVLLINCGLGFFQEYKTEKILEKLKKYIKIKARVRRDGKLKEVEQSLLVPGDIVLIKEGDFVPADLFLFQSENLILDEEILSGESYPVEKSAISQLNQKEGGETHHNLAFSGTLVVKGRGESVVIETGKKTSFGKIAELTLKTTKKSLFEKNILNLSKLILILVLVTLFIVFILNLVIKGSALHIPLFLLFSVALAVSVIPEALPLIVTITFSRGALHLAGKHVAVKRLSAIEDLGNIEILCSDKTGTLTKNILEVKNCYTLDKEKCFLFALLSSGFFSEEKNLTHNPFDIAFWQAAPAHLKEEIKKYQKVFERPFDPNRRSNALVVKNKEGKLFLIFRGAVQ